MISFDLQCQHQHVFEGWFRSSGDYADQASRGMIACPVCNDSAITKAVMAPNVGAKGNNVRVNAAKTEQAGEGAAAPETITRTTTTPPLAMLATAMSALPPELGAAFARIAQIQAEALPSSRWVGRKFAAEARALHEARDGDDAPPAPIHGQATREEAEALADDGIAIMPLLVPFTPPDMLN